ncbi:MAG: HAMP domain-containing protein [Opitutaceae bacterium]|nr:HAMP domain-containing protein [Opitutaceae bacterium]
MKIRTAIFTVYVAASAVGFAVLMRYMLAEMRPRYVMAVRANLQDAAQVVAAALRGRTAAEAVSALASPSSFRVRLMTATGKVLFDSAEPAGPAGSSDETKPAYGRVRSLGDSLLGDGAVKAELEVSTMAEVALADGDRAQLVLSRSFRSVNEVIWAERKKLAGIGLLVAGVMVVAGWWMAARLTRSLERLTAYAQSVRDGRPVAPPQSRATEIAALARAFEEMRDALEGRQHVERYTQALAHEVKAPLAAIRGAAELLGEDMPAGQREKFLGNIRSEVARIQQSIERLLELSSLEARKTLQQAEPIDLAGLMAEAADIMRPAYAGSRVALIVSGTTATLRGERVLLREALVNLLQNALDFSPAGGEVAVTAVTAGGRIVLAVDDRGPGVPDYALARVFERFYSLPRPGTERKSTGLGLTLVREIAHLHGGDASLANRPGGGGAQATFWVPAERPT